MIGKSGSKSTSTSSKPKLSQLRKSDSTLDFVPKISSLLPPIDELTFEQCAELVAHLRAELFEGERIVDGKKQKVKGPLIEYMDGLLARVDQHLKAEELRSFTVPGVVKYTFSQIAGRWTIDGDKLWPKLRSRGISRQAAYDFVPNKDKIASLVNDGAIPLELVEKYTTQSEGHMTHTIKLLEPE